MSGISIIIVNYNVKYFLRQCLQSVYRSDWTGDLEVFVVDNNSSDGSVEMVQSYFPQVKLIANTDNKGFSKANNQAIKQANHAYTLILNPDTIIEEDTLSKCYELMQQHQDAGAVGVKMVDGGGRFLPESKRGFPKPMTALYKMLGLAKLFPKSKTFNQYYLGHLEADKTQEIEVLTGAFTFAKTDLLQEIGGFDEDYFMYGEDIELSFQIKEKGYKLFYLPHTQIIHFKGESTKKISSSYLKNFYGAMVIYAKKRNTGSSFLWSWILFVAIGFTALATLIKKVSISQLRPLVDFGILFLVSKGIRLAWANWYYKNPDYYDVPYINLIYLGVVAIIVFCYYLFGQYDIRHNFKHLTYGFISSILVSLSVYSILPLQLRSSRIVLIILLLLSPFILMLTRKIFNALFRGTFSFNVSDASRVAIVGSQASLKQLQPLVRRFSGDNSLVGRIGMETSGDELGLLPEIDQIVESRDINELLFCSKDIPNKDIFQTMSQLGNLVQYKVADSDNKSILGSNSKERIGEWYALDISFRIDEPFHRRTKRFLDLVFGLAIILGFLVVLIFSKHTSRLFSNLLPVLLGRKSWIGYVNGDTLLYELPALKEGVIAVSEVDKLSSEDAHSTNLYYARNYTTWAEAASLVRIYFGR